MGSSRSGSSPSRGQQEQECEQRHKHRGSGNRLQQQLPHILLLVTDQFRYDAFGPTTTPNLHELAASALSFSSAYSSTPTCTPARAALLTGKSPWNHGMLGYAPAVDCEGYVTTLPSVLSDLLGYETAVVGKNHFGTKPVNNNNNDDDDISTHNRRRTATNNNNKRNHDRSSRRFIDHGYQSMKLYDGLNSIPDDYDEFFDEIYPGVDPLSTCNLGWNDWRGCPYVFDEYLHPTAWTTRQALEVIETTSFGGYRSDTSEGYGDSNKNDKDDNPPPIFLKVSCFGNFI